MMIIKAPESQQWDTRIKRAFSAWMSAGTRKKVLSVGVTAFALVTIPVTLIAVQQQLDLRSRASNGSTVVVEPGRWFRIGPIVTGNDDDENSRFIQFAKASTLNLPIKDTQYTYPSDAIFVNDDAAAGGNGSESAPYQKIQHAVNEAPDNAVIVIREGRYPESVRIENKSVTLQAFPHEKVWFEGSQQISDFVQDSSSPEMWVKSQAAVFVDAQQQPVGDGVGEPFQDPAYPMSVYPEMVFINGTPLQQVGSKDRVRPGTFYIDYVNKSLYIGDDPRLDLPEDERPLIEQTVRGRALNINGAATVGTIIRGIGFRQYGAVHPNGMVLTTGDVRDITFENNTFAWSGAVGLSISGCRDCNVIGNIAVFNATSGFSGSGASMNFTGNLMSFNNLERTSPWGVSGVKVTKQDNTVFADNIADYNLADGYWCDISCYQTTFVRNTARFNAKNGIFYEISKGGIIASNLLVGNNVGFKISGSSDVKFYNNTIVRNEKGLYLSDEDRVNKDIDDRDIDWRMRNVVVRNNIIAQGTATQESRLVFVGDMGTQFPAESLVDSDYNAYYRVNDRTPEKAFQYRTPRKGIQTLIYNDLKQLQDGLQKDLHSIMPDASSTHPFFAGGWNYLVRDGSEALTRGTSIPSDVAGKLGDTVTSPSLNTKMGILHTPKQLLNINTLDEVRKPVSSQPDIAGQDIVVSILPAEETYVDESQQNANFGDADTVKVSQNKIGLLKFDVSRLKDKKIEYMQIRGSSSVTTQTPFRVKLADSDWQEDTVTYATRPAMGVILREDRGGVDRQLKAINIPLNDAVKQAISTGTLSVAVDSDAAEEYGLYAYDTKVQPRPLRLTLRVAYEDETQCPYLPDYLGYATTTVNIVRDGSYRVWSNIRTNGNNGNSYWIKIDKDGENKCDGNVHRVGDSSNIQHDAWLWVDYKNGSFDSKVAQYFEKGRYRLTIYGREPGLQLGRVLLTHEISGATCTPVDNGDNCINLTDDVTPTAVMTATPTITPSHTPIPSSTPTPTVKPTATATPVVNQSVTKRYIRGRIFVDTNKNGLFNATTETVLREVRVVVTNGRFSAFDRTDSTGQYSIEITGTGTFNVLPEVSTSYMSVKSKSVNITASSSENILVNFPLTRRTEGSTRR